ncbi:alpha/beta fold hydrolase [Ideonella sp. DXS29W]|uniref:Alpha/beta fold hydrolase n=1 Tax=Ideonella lacteola TaxID=2984193 RepID=A0ABU9BML9_9BURK
MPATPIRFAASRDGVRLAYVAEGSGPPVVKAAHWLSHIEFDTDSPVWRHWLRDWAAEHRLWRYDERGCGLSDRAPADLSFESWVNDLEAVVDASGLERFALLGVSQGGAVALAYAARHPERVSHLVLYGAYARGRLVRDRSPAAREEADLMQRLVRLGWGRDNEAFRALFTAQFIPGGTLEQLRWFNELQRRSATPEDAARFLDEFNRLDVTALAAQVRCPTLVLHARDDQRVPFDEGRLLAGLIPHAHFVPLDSRNHVLLDEPAWPVFMATVRQFLSADAHAERSPRPGASAGDWTPRERQVLDLIARGVDNAGIADALRLSSKTVRNHVSLVYDKLQVHSRGSAVVRAREIGFGTVSRAPQLRG